MKVIIVSPNEADSVLAAGFLEGDGVEPVRCATLAQAAALIGPGYGCVVLVEEALVEPDMQLFQEAVHAQPPWSDLPLLLIAGQDSSLSTLVETVFPRSGNVSLLQRPLHPVSLVPPWPWRCARASGSTRCATCSRSARARSRSATSSSRCWRTSCATRSRRSATPCTYEAACGRRTRCSRSIAT